MVTRKTQKIRVVCQFSGQSAERIIEAGEVLGISTPGDTVRYLAQRGLEGMSHQIMARKILQDVQKQMDPQQMLDLALAIEKAGGTK
jgi:hypothetical protein